MINHATSKVILEYESDVNNIDDMHSDIWEYYALLDNVAANRDKKTVDKIIHFLPNYHELFKVWGQPDRSYVDAALKHPDKHARLALSKVVFNMPLTDFTKNYPFKENLFYSYNIRGEQSPCYAYTMYKRHYDDWSFFKMRLVKAANNIRAFLKCFMGIKVEHKAVFDKIRQLLFCVCMIPVVALLLFLPMEYIGQCLLVLVSIYTSFAYLLYITLMWHGSISLRETLENLFAYVDCWTTARKKFPQIQHKQMRSIAEFLSDGYNPKEALVILGQISFEEIDIRDLLDYIDLLLDIGNDGSTFMAIAILSEVDYLTFKERFLKFIDKLANLSSTKDCVIEYMPRLKILPELMEEIYLKHKASRLWLPLLYMYAYDSSNHNLFKLEFFSLNQNTKREQKLVHQLYEMIRFEEACYILLELKMDMTPYASILVPECVKRIKQRLYFELLVKTIEGSSNWQAYADTLWPVLTQLPKGYFRTRLMVRFCQLEKYKPEAYNHYHEWERFLIRDAHENAELSKMLPQDLYERLMRRLLDS